MCIYDTRSFMSNKFRDESPSFSEFRSLMDRWDHFVESNKSLSELIDDHGLILFFKKDKEVYGAPEESRLIFAKLKTDKEDDPMQPGFLKEARFPAIKLSKLKSNGEEDSKEVVFGAEDIKKIKVIDREEALKLLEKK